MQDETNLNPQTQAPNTGFAPVNTTQAPSEAQNFSAESQDFSYFDPSQAQEPQTQAPTADYYNPVDNSGFSSANPETPFQDYYSQPTDAIQDPNLAPLDAAALGQQTQEPVNTFIEQKTGNKKLLYIAIGAVIVLLIAAGTLVYLNFNNTNKPATTDPATTPVAIETTPTPETPPVKVVDNTLTGGDNTPATKGRKNSDEKTTLDWMKKSFTSPSIDSEGNCIVLETCGIDSDKDKDGLTTLQEYQYGADPLSEDTDSDGIADGDELYVYFSSPTIKDSDGDTYGDGEEIASCFDPNINSQSTFSTNRLTVISNNVSLKTLHEPSIKTLKAGAATQVDLNSKATVTAKCTKPGTDVVPTASTNNL